MTPAAVPATFEAEDYDLDGQGDVCDDDDDDDDRVPDAADAASPPTSRRACRPTAAIR